MALRAREDSEIPNLTVSKSEINEETREYSWKQSSNGRQVIGDDMVRMFVFRKYAGRAISQLYIYSSSKKMKVLVTVMESLKLLRKFFRSLQAQTNIARHVGFCRLFCTYRIVECAWKFFCRRIRSLIAVSLLITELSRTGLKHYFNTRCLGVFENMKMIIKVKCVMIQAAQHIKEKSLRIALLKLKCSMHSTATPCRTSSLQGLRKINLAAEFHRMIILKRSFQVLRAFHRDSKASRDCIRSVDQHHNKNKYISEAITRICATSEQPQMRNMKVQSHVLKVSSNSIKRQALMQLKRRVENFYLLQGIEGLADDRHRRRSLIQAFHKWITQCRCIMKENSALRSLNTCKNFTSVEKAFLIWKKSTGCSFSDHFLSLAAEGFSMSKSTSNLIDKWNDLLPSKYLEHHGNKAGRNDAHLRMSPAECIKNMKVGSSGRQPKYFKTDLMTIYIILRKCWTKFESLLIMREARIANLLTACQFRRYYFLQTCFKVFMRVNEAGLHMLHIAHKHIIAHSQRISFRKLRLLGRHRVGARENGLSLAARATHHTLERAFLSIIEYKKKCQSSHSAAEFRNSKLLRSREQSVSENKCYPKRCSASASQRTFSLFIPTSTGITFPMRVSLQKYRSTSWAKKASGIESNVRSIFVMRSAFTTLCRLLSTRKAYRKVCSSRLKRYTSTWLQYLELRKSSRLIINIRITSNNMMKVRKSFQCWLEHKKKAFLQDQKVEEHSRMQFINYFQLWKLFVLRSKKQGSLIHRYEPRTNHAIYQKAHIRKCGDTVNCRTGLISRRCFHHVVASLGYRGSRCIRARKAHTLGQRTYLMKIFKRWKERCLPLSKYEHGYRSRNDVLGKRRSVLKLKLKKSWELAPAKQYRILAVCKYRQRHLLLQALSLLLGTVRCGKQRKKSYLAVDAFRSGRILCTVFRQFQDLCRRRRRDLRESALFDRMVTSSMVRRRLHRFYRYFVCKWLLLQRLRFAVLHARLQLIKKGFRALVCHRIGVQRSILLY